MREGAVLKVFLRFLLILNMMPIPVIAFSAADNLVSRMPDLYSYSFTERQISEELPTSQSDQELAGAFSSYLVGQTDMLEILSDDDPPQSLVTDAEQASMDQFKQMLDRTTLGAGVALILVLILSIFLLYHDFKYELRESYKWSWLFYLVYGIITGVAILVPVTRDLLRQWLFLGPWPEEGILAQLVDRTFFNHYILFRYLISLAMMLLFGFLVWNVTKSRRIFRQQPQVIYHRAYQDHSHQTRRKRGGW